MKIQITLIVERRRNGKRLTKAQKVSIAQSLAAKLDTASIPLSPQVDCVCKVETIEEIAEAE